MLYYDDLTFGRRMRRRLSGRAGRGLRAHPLLAFALLVLVAVLAAATMAVLVVLLVFLAALAAFVLACYVAGRGLLHSRFSAFGDRGPAREIGVRAGAERYLAAVSQFAQILQTALGLGTEVRPGDRRLRGALKECEKLQVSLRELARYWRGPSAISAGIYELEDATIALGLYLKQLSREDGARPPAAVLRAQAEALGRRLDAITLRLRRTDFRSLSSLSTASRA